MSVVFRRLRSFLFTASPCLLAANFAVELAAQQLQPGHADALGALPPGAGTVRMVPAGTVYFDGFDLRLDGQAAPLLSFTAYTFGSFVLPLGATHVLFGESSSGDLWRVPVAGGAAQQVGNIGFSYDAAMLDDNRIVVSAKSGGWSSPDNDLLVMDLLTSQLQPVARFPGASGPVAVDAAGHVYYATASLFFPPPAGSVDVYRLLRSDVEAALLAGTVLTIADAQLVFAGLDAAIDIEFDDDGDLFYSDFVNLVVGELHDAAGAQATLGAAMLDYGAVPFSAGSLQFVPETVVTPQVFEPMQPAGGRLLVYETDYVNVTQLRRIEALRPTLSASAASPIPSGVFSFDVTDGPANGVGLLAFAAGVPGQTVAVSLFGIEQPLLLDAGLGATPVVVPFVYDSSGAASLPVANPGFAVAWNALAQAIGLSPSGVIGSTGSLAVQIGS